MEYHLRKQSKKIPNDGNVFSVFTVETELHKTQNHKSKEIKTSSSLSERKPTRKSKMVIYSVMLFLNMISFGFIIPLSVVYVDVIEDLGVTRAEASLIMSVTRGIMFGSGFISSWVYHMLGPIKCVAFGGIIFSVGLLVSSFANHIILIVLPFGILSGIGGSLMNLAGVSAVASSFGRHKALALSYATMGSGIAGIVFPFMFEILIKRFSWRGTIMIYSAIVLHTLPTAYLLKMILPRESMQTRRKTGNNFDFGVFKILEFRLYIAAVFLFGTFGLIGNFFIVDMAESRGFSREESVRFVSVIGVSALIGRILFGVIRQLIGFRGILALPLNSLLLAGTTAVFAAFDGYWPLFASCVICGGCYSVQFAMVTLAPLELLGTEYFPTGLGVSNTVYGIGNIICGPTGGAVKDLTGSYDLVFYAAAIGVLFKGALDTLNVYLKRTHSRKTLSISET